MKFLTLGSIIPDKAASVLYLQQRGLLHNRRICPNCLDPAGMKIQFRDKGDRWRCRKRACNDYEIPLRKDTWFEGSKLPFRTIILFVYSWSRKWTSIEFATEQLDMGESAVVDYNNYMREICAEDLLANPRRIGGQGLTVEVDESVFTKRKNQVGRPPVPQQWVFGGICRETGDSFLYSVPVRNAVMLETAIKESIEPGTNILSDQWAGYNGVGAILDPVSQAPMYTHSTVCHARNFVDPVTGTHTQNIENHWGKAKKRNKEQNGTHRHMLDSYLCEWMWRRRNRNDPCLFEKMMTDIVTHWPPQ